MMSRARGEFARAQTSMLLGSSFTAASLLKRRALPLETRSSLCSFRIDRFLGATTSMLDAHPPAMPRRGELLSSRLWSATAALRSFVSKQRAPDGSRYTPSRSDSQPERKDSRKSNGKCKSGPCDATSTENELLAIGMVLAGRSFFLWSWLVGPESDKCANAAGVARDRVLCRPRHAT